MNFKAYLVLLLVSFTSLSFTCEVTEFQCTPDGISCVNSTVIESTTALEDFVDTHNSYCSSLPTISFITANPTVYREQIALFSESLAGILMLQKGLTTKMSILLEFYKKGSTLSQESSCQSGDPKVFSDLMNAGGELGKVGNGFANLKKMSDQCSTWHTIAISKLTNKLNKLNEQERKEELKEDRALMEEEVRLGVRQSVVGECYQSTDYCDLTEYMCLKETLAQLKYSEDDSFKEVSETWEKCEVLPAELEIVKHSSIMSYEDSVKRIAKLEKLQEKVVTAGVMRFALEVRKQVLDSFVQTSREDYQNICGPSKLGFIKERVADIEMLTSELINTATSRELNSLTGVAGTFNQLMESNKEKCLKDVIELQKQYLTTTTHTKL